MKKLLLATILTIGSSSAFASDGENDQLALCKAFHGLAHVIMENRQREESMIKMIETAGDNEATKALILEAYKRPAYQVESNQKQSANRFANDVFAICMKGE